MLDIQSKNSTTDDSTLFAEHVNCTVYDEASSSFSSPSIVVRRT